jgi:hypothetical protein
MFAEGMTAADLARLDGEFERMGHEVRCDLNEGYKRYWWGRRPEDAAATAAVMRDLAGAR